MKERLDFLLLKLINNPPCSLPHRTLICTRHPPFFKVVTKHILTLWLIWIGNCFKLEKLLNVFRTLKEIKEPQETDGGVSEREAND